MSQLGEWFGRITKARLQKVRFGVLSHEPVNLFARRLMINAQLAHRKARNQYVSYDVFPSVKIRISQFP